MAILNAVAEHQSSSLLGILYPHKDEKEISANSDGVQVCALLDPCGLPEEAACAASALVEEGYTTIKIKVMLFWRKSFFLFPLEFLIYKNKLIVIFLLVQVARRPDPLQDASIIREVRKRVGDQIELRADANRRWTYEKALQFASSVKECKLQYIEARATCIFFSIDDNGNSESGLWTETRRLKL